MEELLFSGRVADKIFVYYGFRYNYDRINELDNRRITEFESVPEDIAEMVALPVLISKQVNDSTASRLLELHAIIESLLPMVLNHDRIITIIPGNKIEEEDGTLKKEYTDDGVHLVAHKVYYDFILPVLKEHLNDSNKS